MGQKSTISWTDATWNPVTGCTPVSDGCANCYAARYAKRGIGDFGTRYMLLTGEDFGTRRFSEIRLHPDRSDIPLRWRKPRRIFVCSMGDLFHESVPDEFIGRVFAIMGRATNHTFQVLTKRPVRMLEWISRCGNGGNMGWITHNNTEPENAYQGTGIVVGTTDNWPLKNVWLGVTAENQATADDRIPLLLQTPAAVRFVSVEPMLGPVDLRISAFNGADSFSGMEGVNWVICGGESGPNARPMHPDWVRSLRDQCVAAGVPFHFKQWGEWHTKTKGAHGSDFGVLAVDGAWFPQTTGWNGRDIDPDTGEASMIRVGKKAAGCLLDGLEWHQFPKETR